MATVASESPVEEHLLGQFIPLVYHFNMLLDDARVNAFREALAIVVQPGMHVLELGGGTGILSSFAARLGARVTCIERNPELVDCSRRLLAHNGLEARVDVVQADAGQYVPHSQVHVVVCEMLHVGLLREKQALVIEAFKRNYRQAFGKTLPVFLPEMSILMVQPIQQSFDFAGYQAPIPMFQAAVLDQPRTLELATLTPYANIAYNELIPSNFHVRQEFVAARSGLFNAIRLATQNVITVDMGRQSAVTWPNQCLVLPVDEPIPVEAGQPLEVQFQYCPGDSIEQLASGLQVRTIGEPTTDR